MPPLHVVVAADDGEPPVAVTVEGVGIQGPDCKALTAAIEKAIGTVESTKKKAEYNRPPLIRRKAGA